MTRRSASSFAAAARRADRSTQRRAERQPIRVAVVGGGCAALAAAFELSRPEHQGRYRLTVYQMGWRLGGKGASGRGPADRIEEHGLHLWMGFYENAFRLMRECYAELDRDPSRCPITSWRDGFVPAPGVAVVDRGADGEWSPWVKHFPPRPGLPGDPLDEHNPFSIRGYLAQSVALIAELLRAAQAGEVDERSAEGGRRDHDEDPSAPDASASPSPEAMVALLEQVLQRGRLATATALLEAVRLLQTLLGAFLVPGSHGSEVVLGLIEAIASAARRSLEYTLTGDEELGRTWQVIDLILACVRGVIASGAWLHPRGFDALDDYDWRDWLRLHGASQASLDSGFMRGIYDLAFAYEDGDPARPRLSASVALRGALRMFFTYRGSLFWKMTAGMGDVVFAPLYEVLCARGVRFEFFHRLEELCLSEAGADDPHVAALRFDVQARVRDPRGYRPLHDVKGLPCWPAAPLYSQLLDVSADDGRDFESPWAPAVAQKTLRVGEHFDLVVLGIGGGAVPMVARQLIARSAKWEAMADNLKFVATQALQLWLKEDVSALGWGHPPVSLSGWVEPFDTWADMSHLVRAESFEEPVRSIAYFCSPLPDRARSAPRDPERHHAEQRERVRRNAVKFLDRESHALWPGARSRSGKFRWELLVDPRGHDEVQGPQRIETQYLTANVRPSDRYALSLPGTARYRISPLDRTFDNLTVAGDWTESGLNTGCVESAVMSGLLAAHALSQSPSLDAIIGYDHP